MYVINPSFLYFIVHCYNMFQNKFGIKIFERYYSRCKTKIFEKTCSAVTDAARTKLIWNKPERKRERERERLEFS